MSSLKDRMNAFKEASALTDDHSKFKKDAEPKSSPGGLKSRADAFKAASEQSTSSKSPQRSRTPPKTPGSSGSLKARADAFKKASTPSPHSTGKGYSSANKKVGSIADKANAFAEYSSQPFSKDRAPSPTNDDRVTALPSFLDRKNVAMTPADAAVFKLNDKSRKDEVVQYMEQIGQCDGFPKLKRLSVRDNDLVTDMTKAIGNDSSISEMKIEQDPRFAHLAQALLLNFAEGLRGNWHLTSLTIVGVELGNDFLSSLANACDVNFTLKYIDLHNNAFTNDGLVEFSIALGLHNDTVEEVNLVTQHSPVFRDAQDQVLEALRENKTLTKYQMDFKLKSGPRKLQEITDRNKAAGPPTKTKSDDDRLIEFLKFEAERAKEIYEQNKAAEEILEVQDHEWDHLWELAQNFDRFKLEEDDVSEEDQGPKDRKAPRRVRSAVPPPKGERGKPSPGVKVKPGEKLDVGGRRSSDESALERPGPPTRSRSAPLEGAIGMTADGEFLNEDFITQYMVENLERKSLLFDFRNQFKMFKRFPTTDPARPFIVNKFVDTLLAHPRMKDITGINLANSCTANDFFEILAEKLLKDPSLLPQVSSLNAETNYLTEGGVVAISKLIADPRTFKYLQVLKLENQRKLLSSKGEMALAKAICVNRGIIRLSMRVRNLLEREQCNRYVQRNIDFIRQARRHHAIQTGTLQERKRNEMEQFFDKIAANDPSITEVDLVGNLKFLSLNDTEKVKSGAAFANNTHIKTVKMNQLKLDCKFAAALGKSLETNSTIEHLLLDSNAIAGDGIKALFAGLANNSSVIELQVRHQSKPIPSGDEVELAQILEPNTTLNKLGLDLRNQIAKINIDKKMTKNRDLQRKARVEASKS